MLDRKSVISTQKGLEPQSLLFEQFNQYKVADVMIQPVIVYPDTKVNDAITSLFMYDVGSLYVVDSSSKSSRSELYQEKTY